MPKPLTDLEIAKLTWRLYREAPMLVRLLATARTYTSSMQSLIAEVPQRSTVFDIGCGSGLFLSLLIANDRVTNAIGCDPNVNALRIAKTATARLVEQRAGVTIDLIEAEDPQNWPDTSFSVVSMIGDREAI